MLAHAGILATLLFSGTFFLALSPLEAAGIPEERLIGWKGEVVDPESTFDPLNLSGSVGVSGIPLPASRAWVEHLSWQPRSFIYHNFITNEEAVHMIDEAAPTPPQLSLPVPLRRVNLVPVTHANMKRSTVIGPNGKSIEDNYRTSYGTFLHRNQFYKVHGDTFLDKDAGARVATILIYLNEPDEGGETAFPDSTWIDPRMKEKHDPSFSDCAKEKEKREGEEWQPGALEKVLRGGDGKETEQEQEQKAKTENAAHWRRRRSTEKAVGVKPKRGDALLFWSIETHTAKREGTPMHTDTGAPILWGKVEFSQAPPYPQDLKRTRWHNHYCIMVSFLIYASLCTLWSLSLLT
eukprot:gene5580-4215_t